MKVGMFSFTFILLLILKLTSVIDISWLWVFMPLIIGSGIIILVGLVALIAMMLFAFID